MSRRDALAFAARGPWQRQGEWGGTTLSRSLTYVGLQSRLADWTGIDVGYQGFLHCGETTYIGDGQFPRFARAYRDALDRERRPLAAFCARFDRLLGEARDLLERPDLRRYARVHMDMQPYSYVFGYGEAQIVEDLVRARTADEPLVRAAFAPASDDAATELIAAQDAELRDLLMLTRRQARIRTDRRELWNRVEAAHAPLIAALGPTPRLAHEMTAVEMLAALDGARPPAASELQARIGGTFLAWRAEAWVFTGAEHARVAAGLAAPETARFDELRGSGASPGRARGFVRRALTPEESDALRPGEILVSDMTTPEMIVACGRAAAIVTDRGGVLCHAAIVSREFGIPCVLGTEHATRSLSDGDLVEVDADAGVVRVVRRA